MDAKELRKQLKEADRARRAQALAMRRQDPPMTYAQIGEALGVSKQRAQAMVVAAEKEEAAAVSRGTEPKKG